AHRFRYHPPEQWRERLAAGVVRVNDTVADAETTVRKGDVVRYTIWHAEPAVDFRYEVLLDDPAVIAVAKSGNLPVHAGGKFLSHTLIARLREDLAEPELRLVHRLDRETSGVVLLARTTEAARALEVQFRERTVTKGYVAVVRGTLERELTVDGPIARREPAEPPYFRVVAEGGKPARTTFVPRESGEVMSGPVTRVEVRPDGGRTNQIRVHAAHAGHPLLGDKIYGVEPALARRFVAEGEFPDLLAAAGAPRHLLHCRSLSFTHPTTGTRLRCEAPVPPDLLAPFGPRGPAAGRGAAA
ncbi:MAG: RluA family pseudouridine synthase, partial [Gemmatimonadetes bacterium]|nr:RluA family pseudouridine synthase [Gemmatimonadota bacterium]